MADDRFVETWATSMVVVDRVAEADAWTVEVLTRADVAVLWSTVAVESVVDRLRLSAVVVDSEVLSDTRWPSALVPMAIDSVELVKVAVLRFVEVTAVFDVARLTFVDSTVFVDRAVERSLVVALSDPEVERKSSTAVETCADVGLPASSVRVEIAADSETAVLVVLLRSSVTVERLVLKVVKPAVADERLVLADVIADSADERLVLSTTATESAAEMLPTTSTPTAVVDDRSAVTTEALAFTVDISTVTVEIGALSALIEEVARDVLALAVEASTVTTDWLSVAVDREPLTPQFAASAEAMDRSTVSVEATVESTATTEVVASCSVERAVWPAASAASSAVAVDRTVLSETLLEVAVLSWLKTNVP